MFAGWTDHTSPWRAAALLRPWRTSLVVWLRCLSCGASTPPTCSRSCWKHTSVAPSWDAPSMWVLPPKVYLCTHFCCWYGVFQLNTTLWGSPGIGNCTLTNVFLRVRGIVCDHLKTKQKTTTTWAAPHCLWRIYLHFVEGGCCYSGSLSWLKIVSTQQCCWWGWSDA